MSEKRVMEGQQMGHTWRNRKPGAEEGQSGFPREKRERQTWKGAWVDGATEY